MDKKKRGNPWKIKLLMLSIGEVFETSKDNYKVVWGARKNLQSQINWRWSIIRDHHGLTQVKRIENAEPNKPT